MLAWLTFASGQHVPCVRFFVVVASLLHLNLDLAIGPSFGSQHHVALGTGPLAQALEDDPPGWFFQAHICSHRTRGNMGSILDWNSLLY